MIRETRRFVMGTEEAIKIQMAELEVDPDLQVRVDGLDPDHVATLAEALDELPAPVCVRRGKRYIPFDGHHSIAAFQNAGRQTIKVRVVPGPEDGDLLGAAFDANREHGKALTLPDKRAFARHLIGRDPSVSNMAVSRRTGLSASTVETIRQHLEDDEGLERADRTVTRGGLTYTYPATRRPGELPAVTAGEKLVDLASGLFSKSERLRQRKITSYVRRLVVALEDQGDLLEDAEEAASAIRLVLGEEEVGALAAALTQSAERLAALAVALESRD
jgi:hypothetical protein